MRTEHLPLDYYLNRTNFHACMEEIIGERREIMEMQPVYRIPSTTARYFGLGIYDFLRTTRQRNLTFPRLDDPLAQKVHSVYQDFYGFGFYLGGVIAREVTLPGERVKLFGVIAGLQRNLLSYFGPEYEVLHILWSKQAPGISEMLEEYDRRQ